MTGLFFEDVEGRHFPVSMIARIGVGTMKKVQGKGVEQLVHPVTLSDDRVVEIGQYQAERLMRAPAHLIPAQPGTYMLFAGERRSDPVATAPVLAWSPAWDGMLTPWTVNGADDGGTEPGAVRHPSGTVTDYDQIWPSVAAWLDARFTNHPSENPAASSCGGTEDPGVWTPPETPGSQTETTAR